MERKNVGAKRKKTLFQNHLLPAGMMKLIGAKKELESRVLKRNKNRHTKTIYVESTTHIRQKKKYIACGLAKKTWCVFSPILCSICRFGFSQTNGCRKCFEL